MSPDSVLITHALKDTIIVMSLSRSNSIPIEITAPAAALFGVIISILGNYLVGANLTRRQVKVEIQKTLFLRRLDVYLKLSELLWLGYSTSIDNLDKPMFPRAYHTDNDLRQWLNDMAEFTDKNRMLLDQDTYHAIDSLAIRINSDLHQLLPQLANPQINNITHDLGRASLFDVQTLSEKAMAAARIYISSNYDVHMETVI